MKIVSIGGGPAGLYFGILMKQVDPACEVTVIERNRADDTFGFGVVFSDATLDNLAQADPDTYARIRERFAHWDDIDTHVGGETWRSTGHGFCGLERKELLVLLQERARELGVDLRFETEVGSAAEIEAIRRDADLVLGADGVSSLVRETYAEHFGPEIDLRPNRFVWLGTTLPFSAFTFYFKESAAGLFRVHAYRYREVGSTFIVECTEDTFRATGLAEGDEDATIAYLAEVFGDELGEHRLIKNRSVWRRFPTVRNRRWHHENVVLVGDAAHTAHFSIGSGTKLAMEDAIDLSRALAAGGDVPEALARYERERRPVVERLQRAAQVSLEWFEATERYRELPPIQFTFSLLTRSLRVSHENLRRRDPAFVDALDRWFCGGEATAPMDTPLAIRGLRLANRIVTRLGPGGRLDCPGAGLVMRAAAAQVPADRIGQLAEAGKQRAAQEAAAAGGGVVGITLAAGDPAALAQTAERAADSGCALIELACSDLELVAAVRRAWRGPLAARLDGELDGDAAVERARRLAQAGVDLVWIVAGLGRFASVPLADRGVDLVWIVAGLGRFASVPLADRVRQEAGVITVAEGGIRSDDDANSVLAAGRADLCVLTPGERR